MSAPESATVDDKKALLQHVSLIFRYNPHELRRRRLVAWLQRDIAEQERLAIVFRPAGEGWEIGREGSARTYAPAPDILRAAHGAISGRAVPASEFAHSGARQPRASVRNRLRRAGRWVEEKTGCAHLADALRRIRVADVLLHDSRYPGAPRFLTQ